MAIDYSVLTEDELFQARSSAEKMIARAEKLIATFDDTPLPKDADARKALLESHNRHLLSQREALEKINAEAFNRGVIT